MTDPDVEEAHRQEDARLQRSVPETEPWCNHDPVAIVSGVCECGAIWSPTTRSWIEPAPSRKQNRILWNVRDQDIDEIVIHNPESVHIEQMDDRTWWIGIYLDEEGNRWSGYFSANSRGVMTFSEQDSAIRWDRDEEHLP